MAGVLGAAGSLLSGRLTLRERNDGEKEEDKTMCAHAANHNKMDPMEPQPLAYLDQSFLESEEARPIRILAEYLEPLRRFKQQQIQDTVVFFGSARIHSRESAENLLAGLVKAGAETEAAAHQEAVRRMRKALEWSRYYEEARELARMHAEWAATLPGPNHRFVVCSGGGPGIMEAANRGAHDAGAKSIGLNISLPFEQGPNAYITPGLHFEFHYFFMRKFWFAYLAKSLVVFPGGFGTLDEMFEILTLMQTQKLAKQIQVILYGTDYWDQLLSLDPMVEWGAIRPDDKDLLQRANTPAEACELLKRHLTENHLTPPVPQEAKAPGIAKTTA